MRAIAFEADVRDSCIHVPREENLEACHVRVVLMWDQDRCLPTEKPNTSFSPPVLNTKGFQFDRQEANARR